MSSLALLEAEIPPHLYGTGKNGVYIFWGVDGGCCCFSLMSRRLDVVEVMVA